MRSVALTIIFLCVSATASADVGWFLGTYVRVTPIPHTRIKAARACNIDSFSAQIAADGGTARWTETLGNRCLIKVKASPATLQAMAASLQRVPANRLNDPLSALTAGQRTAIRQTLLDAGYPTAEVTARFPNLATNTLGDALRFLASRRLQPRYDAATNTIILDGPIHIPTSVDIIDGQVPE